MRCQKRLTIVPNLNCSLINCASYHHNSNSSSGSRRPTSNRHGDNRDRDRLDRIERDRERDRERLHARERDMLHYDINDDDLLNERNYGPADYGGGGSGGGGGGGGGGGLGGGGGGGSDRGVGGGGGMVRGDSRDMRDLRDPVARERRELVGLGASSSSSGSGAAHARGAHNLSGDILEHERELLRERERERELNRGYAVQGGPRQLVAAPGQQSVRRGMPERDRDRDDYSPHRGGGNNRRGWDQDDDDNDGDEVGDEEEDDGVEAGEAGRRLVDMRRSRAKSRTEDEGEAGEASDVESVDEEKLVPDSEEDDGFEYDEFY
ncbi:voltage-dependent calcium channel [Anopheles sinensis]|uniref:Voltage-dependent calcium channel n=1 Tax=Anopheles sinensis TaxID=74873 RepID=A0A084VNG6_ANOSI|nr:voltage-dependent calcium channel [Anopheles sinensis]